MTQDRHVFWITPAITFRVNAERAKALAHIRDFGDLLEARVRSALINEIGGRRDEEVRGDQTVIEDAVTNALRKAEVLHWAT